MSDLLTPWPLIERRLQAAAWGDFVIAFYNPRSQKRDWQLQTAIDILLAHRPPTTPVAIARNVTRPDEAITLTTLAELDPTQVDMFTLVLVGNSQSYTLQDRIVTPRGYVQSPDEIEATQSATPIAPDSVPHHLYPLTLTNMAQVRAVVVGGGPVGERKVKGLLAAKAKVVVISPVVTPQLETWAEAGEISWHQRSYQAGDLAQARVVFAATNQRAVNAQIAQEAQARGLLCNVADHPIEGNFHVPAVHRQVEVVVAVSTTGATPTLARDTRNDIAAWLSQNPKSKI